MHSCHSPLALGVASVSINYRKLHKNLVHSYFALHCPDLFGVKAIFKYVTLFNLLLGRKYAMLKLKIILSTILRNFRIHSDLKEKDFQLQADIILKRAEGFKVRLEPRKRMAKAF